MKTKTFNITNTIAIVMSVTITAVCLFNVPTTGFYPGIFILAAISLLNIFSGFYSKRMLRRSNDFQEKYYTTFTIISLLSALVVMWMTFVIVHDRILDDCC